MVRVRVKHSAVVLFSGGLDSAVTLELAVREGLTCYPLFINYGQTNQRERDYAFMLVGSYFKGRVEPLHTALLDYRSLYPHAVMLGGRGSFAQVEDIEIPYRNALFLLMAGVYAKHLGARYVYTGVQGWSPEKPVNSGTYDTSPGFLADMETVLQVHSAAAERRVYLRAPLSDKSKAEVVQIAAQLNIPLESTWSCQDGRVSVRCGVCLACVSLEDAVGSSRAAHRE